MQFKSIPHCGEQGHDNICFVSSAYEISVVNQFHLEMFMINLPSCYFGRISHQQFMET